MKLEFESIEEVKDFVTKLKGTRGGKADKDEGTETGGAAPEPLKPPAGQSTATGAPGFPGSIGYVPEGAGATQAGAAFPVHVATGPAPEILALVERIKVRIDGAIASGQPAAAVLDWFQKQLGPETANYTMEQIKDVALPKASKPILDGIAGLMNA